MIDVSDLDKLKTALDIGWESWNGDGWYASKDHLGDERGHDYDDAERIFSQAYAVLRRLRGES